MSGEYKRKAALEQDHFDLHDAQLATNYAIREGEDYIGHKVVEGKHAYMEEYEVDTAPDQTEEIRRRYGSVVAMWSKYAYQVHASEATTILSKAIEQVEQLGNYKVMVALVDLDKSKPKEERLYTFCDIESEKLREVIYKEMEKEI